MWENEVVGNNQEQCRDSDSPTGSGPDSNGERSCAGESHWLDGRLSTCPVHPEA